MLPSLLSSQIREAVCSYLHATFPITTPAFGGLLRSLLSEPGSFLKGPYLSLGLPFRAGSRSGEFFPSIPLGFTPHLHQEQAFLRLSGQPSSTLIATGTGSGKTECFLLPILDHCRRADGEGIKAILIYPMNALATDQAGRIARLVHENPSLRGKVTAGLYIGARPETPVRAMTAEAVINDRDRLRLSPPDILLTNYKMLDYMLIRPLDSALWKRNAPETLRYIVVDELHTFDGAQGTDLACLIRRLKARLGTPAGHLCCVGTSATLGGEEHASSLLSYAEKVFGEKFEAGAVISESRLNSEEFLRSTPVDSYALPSCDVSELLPATGMNMDTYLRRQFELWFGPSGESWRSALPGRILGHALFRQMLDVVEGKAVSLEVLTGSLAGMNREFALMSEGVRPALLNSMLALLSFARGTDGTSPLVHVRLQLWMRELRRLVASVGAGPVLRFADDLTEDQLRVHLPVVHCRECGATGWGGVVRRLDSRVRSDLQEFYREYFSNGKDTAFLFPEPRDARELGIPGISHRFCPSCLRLNSPEVSSCAGCGCSELVLVFLPSNRSQRGGGPSVPHHCPYCDGHDSLSIMGAQAATLTSVAIGQLMSSPFNTDRKLLAFSDSVQDAAHRAGFYQARTWRFNLRIAIQRFLAETHDDYSLDEISQAFIEHWSSRMSPLEYVSTFIAPNMLWFRECQRMMETGDLPQDSSLQHRVNSRLDWEIRGEYCFSARIGRTLERSGLSVAHLDTGLLHHCADVLLEPLRNRVGSLRELDRERLLVFLVGLMVHLKNRGAVLHPILESYVTSDGNDFLLSQSHIPWMASFGPGTRAPVFPVDRTRKGRFEKVVAHAGSGRSWYQAWSDKCFSDLSVFVSGDADRIWEIVLNGLCDAGALEPRTTSAGTAWGLKPGVLFVSRDVDRFRCSQCGYIASASRSEASWWLGAPCVRTHCPGAFQVHEAEEDFYARLYSTSEVQRLFTREHTGLLGRGEREKLEREFRAPIPGLPRKPWFPNLLSSTPTLEMGIDIGDLSSLILCSVPPSRSNYLQRTGRAGRRDGNSLSLTVASGRPHDLYFFSDPLEMLAGGIAPPDVFLGASAVLERQLAAYCFDRWTGTGLDTSSVPPRLGQVLSILEDENAVRFPWNLLRFVRQNREDLLNGFTGLFREELTGDTFSRLRQFMSGEGDAEGSLEWRLLNSLQSCRKERASFVGTVKKLNARIKRKQEEIARSRLWNEELSELLREKKAYQNLVKTLDEKSPFNFLTDEGILPNYAFPEAGVQLRSIIFRQSERHGNDEGAWETLTFEYARAASAAIRELVPASSFYAGGRKVVIDQVDMRLSDIENWRFCDSCSHAELDCPDNAGKDCPRCGSALWRDAGQKRQMVRLRQVYATTSDKRSLISDDKDQRDPAFFNRQILVDYRDGDVAGAWKIDADDLPFGFEFLGRATFRDINFGEQSPFGEQVSIAGKDLPRKGFKLCRACGKVQRGDESLKHAITCAARRKEDPETYLTTLYLYREFTSEAVRFLLPVSSLAGSERLLHSFVAALQLGLRLRFGGAVDHLSVTTADEPVKDSVFRKKYLVLYDTVPGGTGYLKQLMKTPGELMQVLRLALGQMRSCSCTRDPERDGCYGCLFAYRQSHDMQSTSRDEAIRFISRVLRGEEKLQPVRSLSDVSISSLLESELEGLFIETLGRTRLGDHHFRLQKKVVNGSPGYFLKAGRSEWMIEPQVILGESDGVSVPCRADFVFRPASGMPGVKPVVVFTDGFRFHRNRLGQDMAQRNALVRSGAFHVWSITWNDIAREGEKWFTDYLESAASARTTPFRQILEGLGARHLDDFRNEDSFLWFSRFLVEPDARHWRNYAFAHGMIRLDLALSDDPGRVFHWRQALTEQVGEFASGFLEETEGSMRCGHGNEGPVSIFVAVEEQALRATDADRLRVLLLLDDRIQEHDFRENWNGFIRLHNLMQFLPGCTALTSGGSAGHDTMRPVPRSEVERAFDPSWREAFSLSDPQVLRLLERVHSAGLKPPEIGWEASDGSGAVAGMAELAWEEAMVAVLCGEHVTDRDLFEERGWKVFTPEEEEARPVVFISALREGLEKGRGR